MALSIRRANTRGSVVGPPVPRLGRIAQTMRTVLAPVFRISGNEIAPSGSSSSKTDILLTPRSKTDPPPGARMVRPLTVKRAPVGGVDGQAPPPIPPPP